MPQNPHYHVVAAVIKVNGNYLCMQRGKTKFAYTSYKFEFPGGKVEIGETPEEALHREIHEELEYKIAIERYLLTVNHEYPDFSITMDAFLCSAIDKDFTMKEHNAYQWLPADRLHELDWAAADLPITREIALHR